MSQSSIASIESKLAALRIAYINDLPNKFSEIDRLWLIMAGPHWQGVHAQDLHRLLHSIAGSGTTFGAPEVSRLARHLEERVKLLISENRSATIQERAEMSIGFRELGRAVSDVIKTIPAKENNRKNPSKQEVHRTNLIYLLSDDPAMTSRYQLELSETGFKVESFADSTLFMRKIKQVLPLAVIIDVASPENSFRGLQKPQYLLTEGQRPPPILYASGRNDIETRLAALKIGAERFFTKPINFAKLKETLSGLTQQAPREAYRILIVDDVETLSEFYATTLETAGFETRVINNPFYALTELEKFNPDLLLMDVYLPECSGLELAAVIRQDDKYAEMPIVFLSSETDLDKQMAAMNLGGDEFLTKPVEPQHLVAAVLARAKRSRWLARLRNELHTALHTNERQKIEFQHKEERLKRSQRYSNIGTWDWDIIKGEIYWSERVMPLFGGAEGEITIRYDDFIKRVHPDDQQKLVDAMQQCVDKGQEYEVEYRVIWSDQSIHWLLERGDVQRDANGAAVHMLGVVQDITNRKELEHRLNEQKSLLSMLQYGLSQYVSSRSIHETGRYMLDALLKLTQSEYGFIGEVLHDDNGKPYLQMHVMTNMSWDVETEKYFVDSNGSGVEISNMNNIFGKIVESGKPLVLDKAALARHSARFPAGHPLPETFAGVPIFYGDDMVGIYGLANSKSGYDARLLKFLNPFNVTYGVIINAYRLTAQEQHIKSDLQVAKDEAEKANKAKSDFLNHMSHELRTPLNAILGFGQLMEAEDEALSVTQQDYLQEMMKAGRHLLDLIDEVLDLARIEAGKLQLMIDTFYLPEVISECHALIEPLAAERNLHLEFCASHCSNVWVQVDRMRLKQILLNLLSNAIKYNREAGEITLTCQEETDSLLRLMVCDTGEGIREDKLHQLYEAFNRLGAENSNIEGTGIGLMISRRMIEMMGGSLAVTSKVGEGSCFSFTVPLSKEQY